MTKFSNKSGFSLVEMVIAMALAAGLLVFYMKMQGEQAKNALTTKVNQEVETFFADFRAIIDRPGFCAKSFENTTLSNNSNLAIEAIKSPIGDIRYQVGEVYGNKYLKLNGINLRNFRADDSDGLEGIATLEISLEKLAKIYGGKAIKKTMDVSVSRDQFQKIIGCGALGYIGSNPTQTPTPVTPATPNVITEGQNIQPNPAAPAASPTSAEQAEMIKALQNSPQMQELQKAFDSMKKNENGEINIEE